jgi:hypothetical protein
MKGMLDQKNVCNIRYYNATTYIILGIMIMKKVFMGMPSFSALGFKQHMLALAVCLSVGAGVISTAQAAPTRNYNPPALKPMHRMFMW